MTLMTTFQMLSLAASAFLTFIRQLLTTSSSAGNHLTEPSCSFVSQRAASCSSNVRFPSATSQRKQCMKTRNSSSQDFLVSSLMSCEHASANSPITAIILFLKKVGNGDTIIISSCSHMFRAL